jgi:hypothetical protein
MESNLFINYLFTELRVFLSDLEFSTIAKFLPGLISAAFQNYVPKSMPKTCALITEIKLSNTKNIRFLIKFFLLYTNFNYLI